MSASLVGSEMCIRDRLPPGCLPPEGLRHPRDGPPPCRRNRQALPALVVCLLYTSDAADDM
eukprot:14190550-Alexandrium_andersonii.AAC.1